MLPSAATPPAPAGVERGSESRCSAWPAPRSGHLGLLHIWLSSRRPRPGQRTCRARPLPSEAHKRGAELSRLNATGPAAAGGAVLPCPPYRPIQSQRSRKAGLERAGQWTSPGTQAAREGRATSLPRCPWPSAGRAAGWRVAPLSPPQPSPTCPRNAARDTRAREGRQAGSAERQMRAYRGLSAFYCNCEMRN